jgi:thiamine-phosphate pyrophosphorylase
MLPRLFVLLDQGSPLGLLQPLAELGVQGFQVRDKQASTACLLRLTELVIAATRPFGASVVVNDRLDVALAAGADGVHLGAEDLPVAAARRLAPGLLIGATCRARADVEAAARDGADYAGFGPVFATASKDGLPAPLGVPAVAEAAGVLPLIGIAGVDADNASDVLAAGAHGVAVIGGLWRQPDPLQAGKELVRAVG